MKLFHYIYKNRLFNWMLFEGNPEFFPKSCIFTAIWRPFRVRLHLETDLHPDVHLPSWTSERFYTDGTGVICEWFGEESVEGCLHQAGTEREVVEEG